MKKFYITVIISILILLACSTLFPVKAESYGIIQPEIEMSMVNNFGGMISILQIVGTGVAVAASIYLGIRYIMGSVEEKADMKKKAVPFVIGVIIFYGATGILQILGKVATWFNP